ncbi:MAG: hypothetical protein ACR2KK_00680 [Acidimicrobiales bacterium]
MNAPRGELSDRAKVFCETTPYRREPFGRRNWGGLLHSLCSYQGKLKPSIAHFLVAWFTKPAERILDPMCGVGTIPLEARRLGRVGLGNDLSPLAACVTRAKVESFRSDDVQDIFDRLAKEIAVGPSLLDLEREVDVEFGLNGPIRSYFHAETLREILIARRFFKENVAPSSARDVVLSSVLHILHGNRPYALSRRSHPVTPFAPSGEYEYRSLLTRLEVRLGRVVPELLALAASSAPGVASELDCRELVLDDPVDAVITSPPFAKSLRFWSMNWLRLWFAGWNRDEFVSEPTRYIDVQQRASMQPYAELAEAMHRVLRPGGLLILHLGETSSMNMAEVVSPKIAPWFEMAFAGRENVEDTESHGLRDKGATLAHWYLFAQRRD